MASSFTRRSALGLMIATLAACGSGNSSMAEGRYTGNTPEMQRMVAKYARMYDIPESLLHRVIRRESGYNPAARNGPYYGLMQIHPATAKTMGYRGAPGGLLDAETNLKYAGKYLRGAWLVSNGSEDGAVKWYSKGYYYRAKSMGLLRVIGLKS